jgi:hypothetical protein
MQFISPRYVSSLSRLLSRTLSRPSPFKSCALPTPAGLHSESGPRYTITASMRTRFYLPWNSDFNSAAFHPVFEYITVRVVRPTSRFFQPHAKELLHSGKLLLSILFGLVFRQRTCAGSRSSPRGGPKPKLTRPRIRI